MTQDGGKLFPDPTFTPPDLPESATYELSLDGWLYLSGGSRDIAPVWKRYSLIDGSPVGMGFNEQEADYFCADLIAANSE